MILSTLTRYDQSGSIIKRRCTFKNNAEISTRGRLKTRLMQGLSNMDGGQKADLQLKDYGPHLEPLLYKTVIITFSYSDFSKIKMLIQFYSI
jgi:hypothetical protein